MSKQDKKKQKKPKVPGAPDRTPVKIPPDKPKRAEIKEPTKPIKNRPRLRVTKGNNLSRNEKQLKNLE